MASSLEDADDNQHNSPSLNESIHSNSPDLDLSMVSNISNMSTLMEYLEQMYIKNPKSFSSYMKKYIKRFPTRTADLDPDKIPLDESVVSIKLKRVKATRAKLDVYIGFLEDMDAYNSSEDVSLGADFEQIEDQLIAFRDQFDLYEAKLNAMISCSKPLATSEKIEDETAKENLADEYVTIRRTKGKSIKDSVEVSELTHQAGSLNLGVADKPDENPKADARRRISTLVAGNLDNMSQISQHNSDHQSNRNFAEGDLQSAQYSQRDLSQRRSMVNSTASHDPGKYVRFSEISGLEPTLNESWRAFSFQSDVVSELALAQIIKSISKITQDRITSRLTDGEVIAINKNKRPLLEKQNENLEKKINIISEECSALKRYAVEAFKAASAWLEALEDIMISRDLHLASDRKYSEPLKLDKFTGYKNQQTNVYEFFKSFDIVARGSTMEEKSHLLFANYLDNDMKRIVTHMNDDFQKMKKRLVDRFGDVNRLLSIKKNQIKSLPQINFRSNHKQKLEFVTGFCEVMDQLQTLVNLNVNDYPTIGNDIFSHSNVMDLSALLPRFLYEDFASTYIKKREITGSESIPGKKAFDILHDNLRHSINSFEFSLENYLEKSDVQERRREKDRGDHEKKDTHRKDKDKKDYLVVQQETNSMEDTVLVMGQSKGRSFDREKFFKSVCFVHEQRKSKVADCRTGRCPLFLNMSPGDRLQWAVKRKLCEMCFLFICKKDSPDKCKYKSQIPSVLSCSSCASAKVERNVLLCQDHKNNNPQILESLKVFLSGYEEGTSVAMLYFSPNIDITNKDTTISSSVDLPMLNKAIPIETRENTLVFDVSNGNTFPKEDVAHKINIESKDSAIYPMQILNIGGHNTLTLFDSGAMGEAVKAELAERVEMSIIDSRPQSFRVAGGSIVTTNNPLYETTLGPDVSGNYHTFPLLGMNKISEKIPSVSLEEMGKEFRKNQVSSPLSKEALPTNIGGSEIELIIGIKRSLLFPTRIMVLPSGLQIWRSPLTDVFGSSLIFCGPHWSVKQAYQSVNLSQIEDSFAGFFHTSYDQFRVMDEFVNPGTNDPLEMKHIDSCYPTKKDVNLLTPIDMLVISDKDSIQQEEPNKYKEDSFSNFLLNVSDLQTSTDATDSYINDACSFFKVSPVSKVLEKLYDDEEQAGCTVDYRCGTCSQCTKCKESDKVRATSVKEEADDILIAKSVTIDLENKKTECVYPFTTAPDEFLKKRWGSNNNYKMAESVFKSQTKKAQEVKHSVIKFHEELHTKGYVVPLKELPEDIQDEINNSALQHYFCWRSIFKPGSVTTKARIVIDPTLSSFNEILAKGKCCLTNLFQIICHWRSHKFVFTSDISKMFNSLQLKTDMYRYSLYLFSEQLNPNDPIQIWVILTMMYGLRSAANQCTHGLKELAEIMKAKFPLAYMIIMKYTYMDDSSGGSSNIEERDLMVEEIKNLLPLGGFKLKVVTKSGEVPCEKASSDTIHSTFAGYKWASLEDSLMLNSSDLNFHPKRRGVKKPNAFNINTEEDVEKLIGDGKLTRKALLGKTLEVYDLTGIWEPLKVRLKLDLQLLKDIDFEAEIPEDLRPRWIDNLKMIHNARHLKCRRAFIPMDAVNPDEMELLICSDAAKSMCGCSVYARFRLKDGSFSSQLVAGRSRSTHSTIPRNELEGCALAAQTAFTLAKVFGSRIKNVIFVSDSTISVCWISNPNNKLKQFVSTRVKLIHRLVGSDCFYHIAGINNPADLVTRGNVTCEDVTLDSRWQIGDPWMRTDIKDMPLKSYADLCGGLSDEDHSIIKKESYPTVPMVTGIDSFLFSSAEVEGDSAITELYHSLLVDDLGLDDAQCQEQQGNCHCHESLELQNDQRPLILRYSSKLKRPAQKKFKPSTKVETQDSVYPVDFVKHGFKKAFHIMAIMHRFILKTRHKAHITREVDFDDACRLCVTLKEFRTNGLEKVQPYDSTIKKVDEESTDNEMPLIKVCSPLDFHNAWHSICKLGTKEVKEQYNDSQLSEYTERDGVLFGGGRLSYPEIRCNNVYENPLFENIDYFQPVFLCSSQITYSLCMYVHWDLSPHSGTDRTMAFVLQIIHVEKLKKVVKFIRETCLRCRYLLKKHYIPMTGNQATYSLMRAPPFFCSMIDIAGTYKSYDSVKRRVTKDAYFLIQCCLITGAVSIHVMEDLSTSSVVLALSRHSSRYGWAKYLILDNQSSFTTLRNMKISFKDLRGCLWEDQKVILDFSTPLAHNEHGRVESKVKALKEYLEKASETSKRHSYVEWETCGMNVASLINGLPICVNQDDRTSLGELSFITPNHFLIGRNNNRAPEKFVKIEDPREALESLAEMNKMLYDLLGNYVYRFIPGRRYTVENGPDTDDIVLFISKEAERSRNIRYKFGRIIGTGIDGRANKVKIQYRNASEAIFRTVDRNVKDLVLIKGIDEIDFNSDSHRLAASIQRKFL